MKTQITKKTIYARFGKKNTLCVGDWAFSNIARILDTNYYHSGVYGWNADIFIFSGFCIVSGYRPFGTSNKEINAICAKYNDMVSANGNNKEIISQLENELSNLINK